MKQLLPFLMLTFSMFVQAQIEITDLEHGNFSSANNVQYVTYVDNEQEYVYDEFASRGFEPQLSVSFNEGVDSYKNFSFGLDFLAAYRANEYFRIGAGLGLDYINLFYEDIEFRNGNLYLPYYEPAVTIPLFANIKVNFVDTKVSPYLGIDVGYNIFIPFSGYAKNNKLGIFFKPAFGADIHFEHITLFIEFAYRYQMRSFTSWIEPTENNSTIRNYSQITQTIGFQF